MDDRRTRDVPVRGELFSDSMCFTSNVANLKDRMKMELSGRRKRDICDYRELVKYGYMDLPNHIPGKTNPTDPLTKPLSFSGVVFGLLKDLFYKGEHMPQSA